MKTVAQFYGFGLRGRGWWLNWRGRMDWCQPSEFETLEELQWAVRRRLSFARLQPAALASRAPRNEYQELWVLVRRFMDTTTTTLTLNFIRETALARFYEHPVSRVQQWVPRSVCPRTLKFNATEHQVVIQDWWLRENPFVKRAAPQEDLL